MKNCLMTDLEQRVIDCLRDDGIIDLTNFHFIPSIFIPNPAALLSYIIKNTDLRSSRHYETYRNYLMAVMLGGAE